MGATADGAAYGARVHEQSIEVVWGILEVPNVERESFITMGQYHFLVEQTVAWLAECRPSQNRRDPGDRL